MPSWLTGLPIRMVSFDDGHGPSLYLCGSTLGLPSTRFDGARLIRFDGAEWSIAPGLDEAACRALAVLDDGGGPSLFIGGRIRLGGLGQRASVAKWNGTFWTPLGGPLWEDEAYALAAVDHDGPGGEPTVIYMGSGFGGYNSIAAWRRGTTGGRVVLTVDHHAAYRTVSAWK